MRKILPIVICTVLVLAGCSDMGGSDMTNVTLEDFVSVNSSESGGMERTSSRWFKLSKGADGEMLLSASLYVEDTQIELASITVEESYAEEIVRIVNEYDMLKRGRKELQVDSFADHFALDAPTYSFSLCFADREVVSLNDGRKKPEGFITGRRKIETILNDLALKLAVEYYSGFFENLAGTWTAPDEGTGAYIAFFNDAGEYGCRIGEHGEEWQRPAGHINSFIYDASEGVYTLYVNFPPENADDTGHSWESLFAGFEIIPANGGGELTVTSSENSTQKVYYFDIDRQLLPTNEGVDG